jgi:hypothetical protein
LGPSLLLEPFRVSAAARAGVNEWQSPALTNPLLIVVLLLAVTVLLRSARSPSIHLPELLLAAAGVALAAWSVRTIAVGALLLAPALAIAATGGRRSAPPVTTAERRSAVVLLAALMLVPGVVWGGPSSGPLSLAADTSLGGLAAGTRVAVEPFSSGWVLWAHPHITVVRDLRAEIYSPETAEAYEAFARGQDGWQDYAVRHGIRWVVAVTGSGLDRSIAAQPGWTETARDEGRVVWHWAG